MSSPASALVARSEGPIGRHVAQRLAREGFDVAVGFEQDDEAARSAADAVEAEGQEAIVLPARVGDPMAAASLVDRAADGLEGLDVLVVGPRTQEIADPAQTPDEGHAFLSAGLGDVEAILQADLKGPLVLCQRAAERMLDDEGGRVCLVAPRAQLRTGPSRTGARSAQAGLEQIVEDAGQALAPDVRVTGVQPGYVMPEESEGDGGAERTWVKPSEVAEAIVQLVTGSSAISGQVVRADGGRAQLEQRPLDVDDDEAADLPGLDQRVEPPDPEDRIDVGEP